MKPDRIGVLTHEGSPDRQIKRARDRQRDKHSGGSFGERNLPKIDIICAPFKLKNQT